MVIVGSCSLLFSTAPAGEAADCDGKQDCESNEFCSNGRCVSEPTTTCPTGTECAADQECIDNNCECTPQSCADGCCSGNACITTFTVDLRPGAGGNCEPCDTTVADTVSTTGECLCNDSVCSNGEVCMDGTCSCDSLASCGDDSNSCDPVIGCSCGGGDRCGTGIPCVNGTCACNANSCAGGCCKDGQCQLAGTNDNACGTGGGACIDCASAPEGNTCSTAGICECGGVGPCADNECCINLDPDPSQCMLLADAACTVVPN